MKRAVPGLAGAGIMKTLSFEMSQATLGRTVDLGDISVLNGQSGCGKTYSLQYFLTHHPQMQGRQSTYLEMPPRPSPTEVTHRVLQALTGARPPKAVENQLTDDLCSILQGSGWVVAIDEAHNLGGPGLQKLRYWHQRGEFSWTLILVGTRMVEALKAAPEIRNRVESLVSFEPLRDQELMSALRQWHPLLAATRPAVLRNLDAAYAQGVLRSWAKILRMALEATQAHDLTEITDQVAAAVLAGLEHR